MKCLTNTCQLPPRHCTQPHPCPPTLGAPTPCLCIITTALTGTPNLRLEKTRGLPCAGKLERTSFTPPDLLPACRSRNYSTWLVTSLKISQAIPIFENTFSRGTRGNVVTYFFVGSIVARIFVLIDFLNYHGCSHYLVLCVIISKTA